MFKKEIWKSKLLWFLVGFVATFGGALVAQNDPFNVGCCRYGNFAATGSVSAGSTFKGPSTIQGASAPIFIPRSSAPTYGLYYDSDSSPDLTNYGISLAANGSRGLSVGDTYTSSSKIFSGPDGTSTAPGFTFNSETTTGIFRSGTADMRASDGTIFRAPTFGGTFGGRFQSCTFSADDDTGNTCTLRSPTSSWFMVAMGTGSGSGSNGANQNFLGFCRGGSSTWLTSISTGSDIETSAADDCTLGGTTDGKIRVCCASASEVKFFNRDGGTVPINLHIWFR